MSLHDEMRRAVDRRVERLRDRYGEFPVTEFVVENDADYFAHGRGLAADGWLGDAGAFVTDDQGRALFIRHLAAPDEWGVPGGGHESGESHERTAIREVREETGVACEVTGVVHAGRKSIVHEADPERRLVVLTAVFEADAVEGGTRDGAVTGGGVEPSAAGDEEVLEARWFPPTDPPNRVADSPIPGVDVFGRWVREWHRA